MRHRYGYLITSRREAEISLVSTHPSLKKHDGFYTLDLYEEEAGDYELIKKLYHLLPAIIKEYTSEELDAAPWLRITPRWSDFFPYPEDDYRYKQIVYGASAECSCGATGTQVEDFCIDSKIKKMKKPFLQLNWVYDEIFVSNQVKDVLLNSSLQGYGFRNVWIRETGKAQSNISQLTVDTMIPPVFAFSKMDIEQEYTCHCGRHRRFLKQGSPLVFKQSVISQICDVDIFKTSECFGRGFNWSHMVFISHKFYRLLKQHHLDSSLILELPEYTEMA